MVSCVLANLCTILVGKEGVVDPAHGAHTPLLEGDCNVWKVLRQNQAREAFRWRFRAVLLSQMLDAFNLSVFRVAGWVREPSRLGPVERLSGHVARLAGLDQPANVPDGGDFMASDHENQ